MGLDTGEVTPKVAHAKAHVAGKLIQAANLLVNFSRLKSQNQIPGSIRDVDINLIEDQDCDAS